MSDVAYDAEVNPASPNSKVRRYAPAVRISDLDASIEREAPSSSALADLALRHPDPEGSQRDLTLAAVAAGADLDRESWLVTDDELFYSYLWNLTSDGITAVFPVIALELMYRLYECGALSEEAFLKCVDAELDHYAQWGISGALLATKERRASRLLARLTEKARS